MADQTIIQVRVDQELKEQAAAVFDSLGIDIPTAVRMFFKATVRMQGLPFSTALNSAAPTNDYSSDGGMTIGDRHFSVEETDAFMKWARENLAYNEEPINVNPLDAVIRRETREEILNDLPEKQREAFILYHKYEYTQREIAVMLGISQKAVDYRLSNAYERIKKFI